MRGAGPLYLSPLRQINPDRETRVRSCPLHSFRLPSFCSARLEGRAGDRSACGLSDQGRRRPSHPGAVWRRLAAVGASIIAAWLFAVLNSGEHSDVLEGIIILVAAGLMLYVSGWLLVKQDPRGWQDYLAHKADNALAQDTVGGRRAGFPRGISRGRRDRTVHQRAGDCGRRLERGAVRGPGCGDARARRAVLFHQPDRAEDSAAAAVHHHLGIPVRDGDQIHRRGRAGIPGTVDAAVHRTERGMAWRHRTKSDARGVVGASYW